MVPTAAGDPLLSGLDVFPLRDDQAILSAAAARKLGVGAGDSIKARVDRRYEDRDESALVVLEVVAAAAEALFPPEGVFLPLRLLVATEDYRDGIAVPELKWRGRTPGQAPRQYAKFRLYANSIYDVTSLKEALTEQGVEVRTQAADIETMRALDKNLSRVFWLIALIGITGFLASLAANLLANVERKRRDLCVVCLLGFPTRSVVMFPMVQAALVGILGAITAFIIYAPVASMLNIWFLSSLRPGESICRLLPLHFLTALLVTLVVAVTAAAWAGYRVARIEPAEGIRDV
jgi:putative ABC transport system permease protein